MNSENTDGKKYTPVGAMFMSVGKNTWKLGDITPKDGTLNPSSEYLQEFDATNGAIMPTKYCYIDATNAAKPPFSMWKSKSIDPVGWWVKPTGSFAPTGPTTERADDVEFKAGQGLYSNFGNAKAKLDFSGEVVCEEWQLDLTGKKYAPIINFLARTIKLGEIVPEDGTLNPSSEYLQEFDATNGAIMPTKYCYIDATNAAKPPFSMWKSKSIDPVGWWVKPTGSFAPTGPTTERADDVEIQPGAGFYSNFGNAKAVLNFPSSIPATKEDAE